MPIYTRTGDDGTTSLYGGKRVLKCEELVNMYGSIDELNSWMGLITLKVKHEKLFLQTIQSDLFTIGGTLAGWQGNLTPLKLRIGEMEKYIDRMDGQLPRRTNFILPGGSELAAQIHIARSICRRVERQTVALSKKQKINPVIIRYLNRLSDLLFVLARFINSEENREEVVWSGSKE